MDTNAERAVAARILDRLDDLVDRLGAAYQENVAEYAALGDAEMSGEVLPVSRGIVAIYFEAVVAGRTARVDGESLRSMGRRRLEMGVPLEPMLHVYRVAGRVVWDAVVEATKASETAALASLGASWMDYIDRASSEAASGYLEASHERLRRHDAQRGALVEALLNAADESDVAAVAAEFNVAIAPTYVPVVAAGRDVAGRVDRVASACPDGTLVGVRGTHLVALVPDGRPDVDRVRVAADVPVIAVGGSVEVGPALRAELRSCDAVVDAALAHERTGVFGTDDLVVEQLVAGDPRLRSVLTAKVLAPLTAGDRNGLITETLEAYLDTGSVPETATTVSVHANTVGYRLRRVAELVGLDPRRPRDAVVLALALTARKTQTGP